MRPCRPPSPGQDSRGHVDMCASTPSKAKLRPRRPPSRGQDSRGLVDMRLYHLNWQ